MMGHWGKLKGSEYDVFTHWRRLLCWRRGETQHIKRKYARRQRREVRVQVRIKALQALSEQAAARPQPAAASTGGSRCRKSHVTGT